MAQSFEDSAAETKIANEDLNKQKASRVDALAFMTMCYGQCLVLLLRVETTCLPNSSCRCATNSVDCPNNVRANITFTWTFLAKPLNIRLGTILIDLDLFEIGLSCERLRLAVCFVVPLLNAAAVRRADDL